MNNIDESIIAFGIVGSLPPPAPNGKENPDNTPDPSKSYCDNCKKERINTRCYNHIEAMGCNYCHLMMEHMGVPSV